MESFFVTGTDTEVGKTEVSCALANKHKMLVKKPVESDCVFVDGNLFPRDANRLLKASKSNQNLDQVCKFRFEQAISPESAALIEKKNLLVEDLVSFCKVDDPVIVEGAGGFLSPIAIDGTNADFAQKLGFPIVLVVANRLGCVNHTLLTIEAIKKRGLKLQQIFLTKNNTSKENYLNDLKRWTVLDIISFDFSSSEDPWADFVL